MTAAVQLAFAALAAEQAEDQADEIAGLRRQLEQIRAAIAAPPVNHAALDMFAALLEARLPPRIEALEERLATIGADLAMVKIRTRRARR